MKDHITRLYGTSETANARIHELESQLGIPQSENIEDIVYAWDRLAVLEEMTAVKTPTAPFASKPKSDTPKANSFQSPFLASESLSGLARAIAANQRKHAK